MIELLVINGEPDAERKACSDCRSMKAAVGWWCMNSSAIKYRGTALPGIHSCQFWSPAEKLSHLGWWDRFRVKWGFGFNFHQINISESNPPHPISP